MGFNLDNYSPVEERITQFYADWPGGSIRTFVSWASDDMSQVLFEARVYRTVEEATAGVYTSGYAYGKMGRTPVEKTSWIETAETSAAGRALANLDYSGHVSGNKAPRPSREEMSKAERTNGAAQGDLQKPWERVMPFGKSKGKPLHEISDDVLESTIKWCQEKDAGKFADLIQACADTLDHRTQGAAAV